MDQPPFLTTDRLALDKPRLDDVWPMFTIVSHAETRRYLGPADQPADFFTRFQRGAGSWMLHGYGPFMLREHGRPALIGNCGIFHSYRGLGEDFDDQPEAGWILAAEHAGKGFAGEAMRAAIAWFERAHGRQRIVCMISPGNEASFRLADKLGFAVMREAELAWGEPVVLLERQPV